MEQSEQLDQLLAEAESLRFSDGIIKIIPLSNGRWALFGLSHEPPRILNSLDLEAIQQLSKTCLEYGRKQKARHISTAEARFYGEPKDRDFVRDLRRSNREPTALRQAREVFEALEL